MRQDICSIPIGEIFEPRDGCPFCRMRDMLEDRMATYITGAAMMEPDVRVETNHKGFCKTHFDMILQRGSRLSVALILESLLGEVDQELLAEGANMKKLLARAKERDESCFVCENIEKNMTHLSATVLKLWQEEAEFRALYSAQTHICVPHYHWILREAASKMNRKNFPAFSAATAALCGAYMQEVRKDITHFCRMFDYRNAGGDWGTSKDAIERAIAFLSSREVTESTKTEGKNR